MPKTERLSEKSVKILVSHGIPGLLTSIFTDCSVASRVVARVQWIAHPTSNQGDAGSIPTHGTYVFHSKGSVSSSSLLLASDYIVGFPPFFIHKSIYGRNSTVCS